MDCPPVCLFGGACNASEQAAEVPECACPNGFIADRILFHQANICSMPPGRTIVLVLLGEVLLFGVVLLPLYIQEIQRLRSQAQQLAVAATVALVSNILCNVALAVEDGMLVAGVVFFTSRIVAENITVSKLSFFFVQNFYSLLRKDTKPIRLFFRRVQALSSTLMVSSGIVMLIYVYSTDELGQTRYNNAVSSLLFAVAWMAFSLGCCILYFGTKVINEVTSITISGEKEASTQKRAVIAARMRAARRMGALACVFGISAILPMPILFWTFGLVPFFYVFCILGILTECTIYTVVYLFSRKSSISGPEASSYNTSGAHRAAQPPSRSAEVHGTVEGDSMRVESMVVTSTFA